MIKLLKKGKYSLVETRRDTKILKLDKKTFVWIYTKTIGEILVATHRGHKTDQKLAKGEYRIYKVKDEPKLTDMLHLKLAIGEGGYQTVPPESDWQGYLLPTGFPKDNKTRTRIIPTNEQIAK